MNSNPITLNDLLMITAARQLSITVAITRTLTASIQVDSNDLSQWDEISRLYGCFDVREISVAGDALAIALTPAGSTKGGD